jgi:hypothetical protein
MSSPGSSKTSIKWLVVKVLIVLHVGMLVLTATRLNGYIPKHRFTRPIANLVTLYSKVTLNNQRFAFFAPTIPTYLTPKVVCTRYDGSLIEYKFPLPNREVQVRFNKMIRNFNTKENRAPLSLSLANYIKLRNPDISRVDLYLYENFTPTMKEYRRGKRTEQKLYYKASYIASK